jgi:hypothetical protein
VGRGAVRDLGPQPIVYCAGRSSRPARRIWSGEAMPRCSSYSTPRMSGLFTPVDSMPDWAQRVAEANPVKHFVSIMRAVLMRGAGLETVGRPIIGLGVAGGAQREAQTGWSSWVSGLLLTSSSPLPSIPIT